MKTPKKISVSERESGMIGLFQAIAENPKMQFIDVNDNKLKDELAVDAMVDALTSLNFVSYLNTSDCLLGDQGAFKLIDVLKNSNPHCRSLSIITTNLNRPGFVRISMS